MLSNYPPDVTGNEPQITGEWPVDELYDEAAKTLSDQIEEIETVYESLDENPLEDYQMENFEHAIKILTDTRDELRQRADR